MERALTMVSDLELKTLTRTQLLALAKSRGVQLPTGNISKAKLIELLRAAKKAERTDERP
jgi:hypothetical protein